HPVATGRPRSTGPGSPALVPAVHLPGNRPVCSGYYHSRCPEYSTTGFAGGDVWRFPDYVLGCGPGYRALPPVCHQPMLERHYGLVFWRAVAGCRRLVSDSGIGSTSGVGSLAGHCRERLAVFSNTPVIVEPLAAKKSSLCSRL